MMIRLLILYTILWAADPPAEKRPPDLAGPTGVPGWYYGHDGSLYYLEPVVTNIQMV